MRELMEVINATMARRMHNAGESVADIARAMKRSPATIRRWIKLTYGR
jgi:hypothetical protein